MIRYLLFLLLLWWPFGAGAQTVRVASGEHADFSRLVLGVRDLAEWEFGRVEGGFEFRSQTTELQFDLSRVYDLIPRDRISTVADLGDGALFLGVDCDCHADAFQLAGGQIVLDIKDGPARFPQSPFERVLEKRAPADAPGLAEGIDPELRFQPQVNLEQARAGLPLSWAVAKLEPPIAPAFEAFGQIPRPATTDADPLTGSQQLEMAPALTDGAEASPAEDLAMAETALLEQISRAASQGLLTARTDQINLPAPPPAAPAPLEETEVPQDEAPLRPDPSVESHVSIETAIDQAFSDVSRALRKTDGGQSCLADDLFDVGAWGSLPDDPAALGDVRGDIVNDLDVIDPEAVSNLVKRYVFMGFGAEAQALLRLNQGRVPHADILKNMAEIVDFGAAEAAVSLVAQIGCDGPVALWAALAAPFPAGTNANTDAMARAFVALPAHLRVHLGPVLAQRLIEFGDAGTADIILNAASRTDEPPTTRSNLVTARAALERGESAEATKALEAAVSRSDEVLPEVVLERVRIDLDEERRVPEATVALLDSLAFEYRGTDTEKDMREAEIRALAYPGTFAAALQNALDLKAARDFDADRLAALVSDVFSRSSKLAADDEFLRDTAIFLEDFETVSDASRRDVAERFLALGLARKARETLERQSAAPEPDDRLLFAKAAVLEGKPAVAIGYLAGLTDVEAMNLRAQAMEAAGDYAGAYRAFVELGDEEASRRVAWRGGLWRDLAGDEADPLAAAAQLMIDAGEREAATPALPPGDPVGRPTLAQSQDRIDSSRATRDALAKLLAETGAGISSQVSSGGGPEPGLASP